ncbi:MAG: hypothetical protein J4N98_07345, partial [Chloroflexi bacterium]|nr:hypothetical protein [Chloroflexota bacterium]
PQLNVGGNPEVAAPPQPALHMRPAASKTPLAKAPLNREPTLPETARPEDDSYPAHQEQYAAGACG